ncbi:hypothetical protein P691DRAFT_391721 [Macrolepiota fuliginosa MF-IS2]|uniref:Nephrocystin 3-like N-terminal domain-containing protein n=1 Tax=Macrolepiota fuliginosa MF-IS2 TaxID=1400762 RepID=A0A9P6C739_9AGAR|nr:hypothetical protein P691DRAFT_391721 [Macrolepiota fuliginosa MF-IS2]
MPWFKERLVWHPSHRIHSRLTDLPIIIVLDILCEEMTPGADLDSAARWPQPLCYPGTRIRLQTKIYEWFFSDIRHWNFLWLNGPAGVGKSAVAQTVAEYALENDILGAVYFFSRPNGRNKYTEVFITLAYQLGVRFPGYQPLVGAKLAAEPDLLTKAPRIQFRKLIVEPLLSLSHERKRVIMLDGLDECDDEDNQLEIIELINDLLRSNTSLPIIWMVCSRPESHLKRIFARSDYAVRCWREFLPIDSEESRNDTEIFIRGRFDEIHERYGECLEEDAEGSWPPETGIKRIVEKASGLFVLADTLLRHIDDPKTRNPDRRLSEVLAFLEHSHVIGSQSPMHDLDLFYTLILSDIPVEDWLIIRQILVASTFRAHREKDFVSNRGDPLAVQPMCNLLGISRAKFYIAMRRLHSVVYIPEPSDAAETPLHFFHATFLDYLTDPNRAGRFFIGRLLTDLYITVATGLRDFVLSGLRCLGSNMVLPLIREPKEVEGDEEISRTLRAALSWSSKDARANCTSAWAAVRYFRPFLLELLSTLLEHSELDDDLLNVLCGFDFNIIPFTTQMIDDMAHPYLSPLNKLRPSSLIRTQCISEWDRALLSKIMERDPNMKPFEFGDSSKNGFFLFGNGTNSIAVRVHVMLGMISFSYVSHKRPPKVWPVLQHISLSQDDSDGYTDWGP